MCAQPDKRAVDRRRGGADPGRGSFSRPCRPVPAAADASAAARSAAAGGAADCVCPGASGGAAAERQGAAREQGPAGQDRRDPDTGFSNIKQRRARGVRATPGQPAAARGAPAAARRTRRALWRGPFRQCSVPYVQARDEQGKNARTETCARAPLQTHMLAHAATMCNRSSAACVHSEDSWWQYGCCCQHVRRRCTMAQTQRRALKPVRLRRCRGGRNARASSSADARRAAARLWHHGGRRGVRARPVRQRRAGPAPLCWVRPPMMTDHPALCIRGFC
jgi:hypothetical protein